MAIKGKRRRGKTALDGDTLARLDRLVSHAQARNDALAARVAVLEQKTSLLQGMLDEALFPSPLVDFYDVDMLTGEARPLVVWERGA